MITVLWLNYSGWGIELWEFVQIHPEQHSVNSGVNSESRSVVLSINRVYHNMEKSEKIFILRKSEYFVFVYDTRIRKNKR